MATKKNKEEPDMVSESSGLGRLESALFKGGWNSGFGNNFDKKCSRAEESAWGDDDDTSWGGGSSW